MRSIGFIAIPKTASMSMAAFCRMNSIPVHWHGTGLYWWAKSLHERQDHDEILCVMRDPADRVISAYAFLRGGGKVRADERSWAEYCQEYEDIDHFVTGGLKRASLNQLHFCPQWFSIDPPSINPADLSRVTILRFAHLQSDLNSFCDAQAIPRHELERQNASQRSDINLSDESREVIREIYKRDYEMMP